MPVKSLIIIFFMTISMHSAETPASELEFLFPLDIQAIITKYTNGAKDAHNKIVDSLLHELNAKLSEKAKSGNLDSALAVKAAIKKYENGELLNFLRGISKDVNGNLNMARPEKKTANDGGRLPPSLADGLVVAIMFDQLPLIAWTKNGNKPCKMIGTPILTDGVHGKAVKLDTTSHLEYDVADALPINSTPRTSAFWFAVNTSNGLFQSLVEWGNTVERQRWFTLVQPSGTILFGCEGLAWDVFKDRVNVCNGEWHHAAFVFGGETLESYLDGKLMAKSTFKPITAKSALFIGRNCNIAHGNGEKLMSGKFDDVLIWNRALSANEVGLIAKERSGK